MSFVNNAEQSTHTI